MGIRHLDVAAVLGLAARRQPVRAVRRLRLASEHLTLRDLIARSVAAELHPVDARAEAVLVALLGPGFERWAAGTEETDTAAETERALQGFLEGRYRVLLDGHAVSSLDERLTIGLRSTVTFVRVVPLVSG